MKQKIKFLVTSLLCFLIIFSVSVSLNGQAKRIKSKVKTTKEVAFYEKLNEAWVIVVIHDIFVCSGFVADPKGYVITVARVLSPKHSKIEVISPVFGRKKVEVAAIDEGNDLALLKLPKRRNPYPALNLSTRERLLNSACYIFGSANFTYDLFIKGLISSPKPNFHWRDDNDAYTEMVRANASIPAYFHGGAWVDKYGEVIGVQAYIGMAGLISFIPLEPIRSLLKTKKTASTPTIGIQVTDLWWDTENNKASDFYRYLPKDIKTGVKIIYIVEKGPAIKADLKKGEFIYKIDGTPVEDVSHFIQLIRSKKTGDKIKLNTFDAARKKKREVTVKLENLEREWR